MSEADKEPPHPRPGNATFANLLADSTERSNQHDAFQATQSGKNARHFVKPVIRSRARTAAPRNGQNARVSPAPKQEIIPLITLGPDAVSVGFEGSFRPANRSRRRPLTPTTTPAAGTDQISGFRNCQLRNPPMAFSYVYGHESERKRSIPRAGTRKNEND